MLNRNNPPQEPCWTDEQLDDALRQLQLAASPEGAPLTVSRAALLDEAAGLSRLHVAVDRLPDADIDGLRRRRRRPALVAAAIAVLVSAGLLAPSLWARSSDNAAATAALERAAVGALRTGEAVGAGQFRYLDITSRSASMGSDAFIQDYRHQIWVPANWADPWMERRSSTNDRQWIGGTEADAAGMNLAPAGTLTAEPDRTGPCRNYFVDICASPGDWATPTQAWTAGLPTDPDALYDRLHDDSAGQGQSDESMMIDNADAALRSGLLPATVQATLYRAIAEIPDLVITEHAVTADGRVGTGFSATSPYLRTEIMVDTATGRYLGYRLTTLVDDGVGHIPAGTVIDDVSFHSKIVDALGAT